MSLPNVQYLPKTDNDSVQQDGKDENVEGGGVVKVEPVLAIDIDDVAHQDAAQPPADGAPQALLAKVLAAALDHLLANGVLEGGKGIIESLRVHTTILIPT